LKSLKEDKPRGRPQAPDVCASLRHPLAPTHNLRVDRHDDKTGENGQPANTDANDLTFIGRSIEAALWLA
jgi:hypothetical protein